LASAYSNRIFEPEALTEDYENGLRLFRLGCSQAFVPLCRTGGGFLATREYFPQNWSGALRQRTRWVTGIALQSWQRFGWMGKPGEMYWLWRDRKGLLANPLSVAANVLFLYGAATSMWLRASPLATRITWMTLALQVLRTGVRMGCSGRVYGARFALGVPLRTVYANLLNSAATLLAGAHYASARMRDRPLKWLKTAHAFPPPVIENNLQQGFPRIELVPAEIPRSIARALPEHFTRKWRVLPFKVAEGSLFIAGTGPPAEEMKAELRSFTALEVRFHLMTRSEFSVLVETAP
jgi:adsorption protein B